MEPFKLLVSQERAQEIIFDKCRPIERTETVCLEQAAGRVLAADLRANRSVPPFNRSAMDGYAVIAEDTFGADVKEVYLELDGAIHAGEVSKLQVTRGHCVQIATGSPIPAGADAVVMVEFTERHRDRILVTKPVYPGANISRKGEDIEEGEVVLPAGTFMTPAKVGAVAALGMTEVEVYARPRVVVIPTGREVVEPGHPLGPGQIYDVNSYTLMSVLRTNGAQVQRHAIVTDEREKIKDAIEGHTDADLIVLSGGSSVGEKDLLAGLVEELGEMLFHGVQIKPGKPTLFGMIGETPLFGMPGYPTSCLSNAYIFLIPTIRRMARLPEIALRTVRAQLTKRVVSSSGRKQFLTVRIEDGRAYPAYKHSGAITSMANADGYIVLPTNLDVIDEGEYVEVTLFE